MTAPYDGGSTRYTTQVPEWSRADRFHCRLGHHEYSRKVAVDGHIKYCIRIQHAYCACGKYMWMWFDDGWLPPTEQKPGALADWIETMLRFEEVKTQ